MRRSCRALSLAPIKYNFTASDRAKLFLTGVLVFLNSALQFSQPALLSYGLEAVAKKKDTVEIYSIEMPVVYSLMGSLALFFLSQILSHLHSLLLSRIEERVKNKMAAGILKKIENTTLTNRRNTDQVKVNTVNSNRLLDVVSKSIWPIISDFLMGLGLSLSYFDKSTAAIVSLYLTAAVITEIFLWQCTGRSEKKRIIDAETKRLLEKIPLLSNGRNGNHFFAGRHKTLCQDIIKEFESVSNKRRLLKKNQHAWLLQSLVNFIAGILIVLHLNEDGLHINDINKASFLITYIINLSQQFSSASSAHLSALAESSALEKIGSSIQNDASTPIFPLVSPASALLQNKGRVVMSRSVQ